MHAAVERQRQPCGTARAAGEKDLTAVLKEYTENVKSDERELAAFVLLKGKRWDAERGTDTCLY